MTTIQFPDSPVEGEIYTFSDVRKYVFNGGKWSVLGPVYPPDIAAEFASVAYVGEAVSSEAARADANDLIFASSANTYANNVASTAAFGALTDAKLYTDEQLAANLVQANHYSDMADQALLSSANAHADTAASAAQTSANTYTDGKISALAATIPSSTPYDVAGYVVGMPDAQVTVLRVACARAFKLPASLTGSVVRADVAATAPAQFTMKKNGAAIGSFSFAASATSATFTFTQDVSFASGDVFTIDSPSTQDSTLADIAFTLKGELL